MECLKRLIQEQKQRAHNIAVGPPIRGGSTADLVPPLNLITLAPELRNSKRIRPFSNQNLRVVPNIDFRRT